MTAAGEAFLDGEQTVSRFNEDRHLILKFVLTIVILGACATGVRASTFSGPAALTGAGGDCLLGLGVSILGVPGVSDTANGFAVSTAGIQVSVGLDLLAPCTATFTFSRPLADSAALYEVFSGLESSAVAELSLFTVQYTFEVFHDSNPADSALALLSIPTIGLLTPQGDSDTNGPFAAPGTGNLIGVLSVALTPLVAVGTGVNVGLGNSLTLEAESINLDEAAIPEPSSALLFLGGAIALIARWRVRRSSRSNL